ncbi:MAG: BCCT family transporter [Bdellovibrionales bacterium]|nr:BCCT family transporter [Bdellovibrionales bacterium]
MHSTISKIKFANSKLHSLLGTSLQKSQNLHKISINPVFIGSSVLIFTILVCSFAAPELFFNVLSWVQNIFVLNISWFYVLLFFLFFCLCIYLAFGPYGKVRLGVNVKPKYSYFTWIAMLFSAGMGTGLLFSGVYEPLYHYFYPPVGVGGTEDSLQLSFQLTFLHWGFSGWAVYTLVGLAIAYFSFCKNQPFRISSMLYPVLKKKAEGFFGISIDILSVTVILLGVATTLGRGTMQINSGLKELFGIPYSSLAQSVIILFITCVATFTLLSGLNRGIRRLSELNIVLCFLLLLFVLFVGPTSFLLNSFVEYSGAYLQNMIKSMTWVNSLGSVEWRSRWTILYWAWWIAWAPFVGLFIARISEGRSIREFVMGCLLFPTLLSCLWFVVFGGTAIHHHISGEMSLQSLLKTEYSMVVFAFLKHLPWTGIASVLTLLAVAVFFITSSDSASYVIHRISTKSDKSPLFNKVYWALLEGFLAIVLVYFGGIKSLELLVIIAAFPFSIIICLICYSFFKELKKDFS